MISFIIGKIINSQIGQITILTSGGVGYRVFVKPNSQYVVGDQIEIHTHLAVGENMMDLYGFSNINEKDLFLNFLSVSGIGPKSALHLLSLGTVEDISQAISSGDIAYLTAVSGVGKKTAERIVVELRSKVSVVNLSETGESSILSDVIAGLVSLGYSQQQAREVVKKLNSNGKSSEQLMREALQLIR